MPVWIAKCILQNARIADDLEVRLYSQMVAVLADDDRAARKLIDLYYLIAPFELRRIEMCLPAAQYLELHGAHPEIEALQQRVDASNLFEFGKAVLIAPAKQHETTFRDVLMRYGASHAPPLFAVVDGAQFENLPVALFDGQFASRPLYKSGPTQHSLTAPYLVALNEGEGRGFEQVLDALLALVEDRPATVFWQCPGGFETLYHHLRTLGRIMIPMADVPGTEAEARAAEGQEHAMVVFRHGDANVMAQIMQAITEREAARLFGPARALLFESQPDWSDGRPWLEMPRDRAWPDPTPGPLHLSQNTMNRMRDQREARFLARIESYLLKVVPEKITPLNRFERDKAIRAYVTEGRALGITSEAAFGRWCYMQFMLGGGLFKSPEVRQCFNVRSVPPDQAIKELLQHTIKVAKQHGL